MTPTGNGQWKLITFSRTQRDANHPELPIFWAEPPGLNVILQYSRYLLLQGLVYSWVCHITPVVETV